MTQKRTGKLIPIKRPTRGGIWLRPHIACKYFGSGEGIEKVTLMNKIYAGELRGFVKFDHTGWFVWIANDAIRASKNISIKTAIAQQPLKVA